MKLLSRLGVAVQSVASDNPVLEKDALSQLRLTRTQLQILGLLGLTFLAAAAMLVGSAASDGRTYGVLDPGGRIMFAAILGVALVAQTLMIPLIAASSIASERERGTLPLMTASALSPMQIVVGKLLAVLATVLPMFLPALALMPLAYAYGDVSLLVVVAGIAACAWHGFSMAAIGVSVSAAAERLRVAAPQALALALGVAVVGAAPLGVLATLYAAAEDATDVVPFALFGVLIESTVAWLSLVNARSALAPLGMRRWSTRRPPVLVLIVVGPLAAAALSYLFRAGYSTDELTALLHVEAALIVLAAVMIEVAVADQCKVDRRSPARTALALSALAGGALLFARMWPAPAGLRDSDESLFTFGWASVFVLVGYMAFSATLVAVAARVVARPTVRVGLSLVVLVVLFVAPLILHEARHVIDLGLLNFLWLQPVALVETLERDRDWTSSLLGVSFFFVAPLLLAWIGRQRPSNA